MLLRYGRPAFSIHRQENSLIGGRPFLGTAAGTGRNCCMERNRSFQLRKRVRETEFVVSAWELIDYHQPSRASFRLKFAFRPVALGVELLPSAAALPPLSTASPTCSC